MRLKNRSILLAVLFLGSTNFTGCESLQNKPDIKPHIAEEFDKKEDSAVAIAEAQPVPEELKEELLADIQNPQVNMQELEGERFDVSSHAIDIRPFFTSLVDGTPYSVAVHPEVTGKISLTLKEVTLNEVINVVRRMYDIDVFKEGKVVQVLPARMRTESISVNYLMMQRNGISTVSVVSGGVSQFGNGGSNGGGGISSGSNFSGSSNSNNNNNNLSSGGGQSSGVNGASIQTATNTDFWTDLKTALESLMGKDKGRYVIVSPQASLVTVHGLPSEISAIKDFLKKSEQSLQRQVILEAKVIEVTLKDEYQQGVNWSQVLGHVNSTDFTFSTTQPSTLGNSLTATLGGITNIVFKNEDFSGVVNLLSTQGDVQMLSNPRVTATNNQKAVIKVGEDEYFVTNVSTTTVTGTATSTTPDVELTPFFSGIALDVTPQIDEKGAVILHVHPSVTDTSEQVKVITLSDQKLELPLAQSNIRESDTVIRAQSGEIVVIGGLMQTITSDIESKTPILGDIPLVGNLFRSINSKEEKKELIILIKPTVIMPDSWQQQKMRSLKLLNSWYQYQ